MRGVVRSAARARGFLPADKVDLVEADLLAAPAARAAALESALAGVSAVVICTGMRVMMSAPSRIRIGCGSMNSGSCAIRASGRCDTW